MNENLQDTKNRAIELLRKSNDILIALSGPDGDSIGSGLALALFLKKLGKKLTVMAPSPASAEFQFLPGIDQVKSDMSEIKSDLILEVECADDELKDLKYEIKDGKLKIIFSQKTVNIRDDQIKVGKGEPSYDLIVTVDTGDRHQLGKLDSEKADIFEKVTVLNIDHHSSNSKFGDINYVDPTCASTTEVLYPILEELQGQEDMIDADIATLLLAGLIADTGSFVHSNTTPSAFKLASLLLAKGARQQEIIKNFFKTKSLEQLKLWGCTLSKLQFDSVYKLAWSSITEQDLVSCNAKMEYGEGIIDELMTNVPGTQIAILLKEKEKGLISGSLRSTTDEADVSKIAAIFNGGGHVRASGFRYKYEGNFQDAEKYILDSIKSELSKKMSSFQKDLGPQTDNKLQSFSIEINGQKHQFSEDDIKNMALNFILSQNKDKKYYQFGE